MKTKKLKRPKIKNKFLKNMETPSYSLILFKIKGHKTWRASLQSKENLFENTISKKTKITEKKVYRINRINGTITEK